MVEDRPSAFEAYERRKVRLGVRLTLLYAAVYAGFVVLNVFFPPIIQKSGLFGLNLALTYGLGLIILAVVLALLYNWLCGVPPTEREEG